MFVSRLLLPYINSIPSHFLFELNFLGFWWTSVAFFSYICFICSAAPSLATCRFQLDNQFCADVKVLLGILHCQISQRWHQLRIVLDHRRCVVLQYNFHKNSQQASYKKDTLSTSIAMWESQTQGPDQSCLSRLRPTYHSCRKTLSSLQLGC